MDDSTNQLPQRPAGPSVDGVVRRPPVQPSLQPEPIVEQRPQTTTSPALPDDNLDQAATQPSSNQPEDVVQQPSVPPVATETHEAPIPVQVPVDESSDEEISHNPLDKLQEVPVEEPSEKTAEGKVTAAPLATEKNHKGHGAAVLVAVLIALSLIGGAGYAYWQSTRANQTPASQTKTTEEVKKNPATAEDVQKASDGIDASLKKLDDTADFQEADLTDTTLGL